MVFNWRPLVLIAACSVVFLATSPIALAHPFHTTTAEMEYNSHTGRYEVTLKVLAADLEEALATLQATGPQAVGSSLRNSPSGQQLQVDLERTPQIEKLISSYLNRHFYLSRRQADTAVSVQGKASDEKPPKSVLRWVGLEVQKAWAWLYFELEPVGTGDQLVLTNSVFFEMNAGQLNTCVFSQQSGKTSLKTSAKQPAVIVPQSTSPR